MMRFDNEFGQYLFTAVHVRQVQAPSIYIGVVCGCVHPGVSFPLPPSFAPSPRARLIGRLRNTRGTLCPRRSPALRRCPRHQCR